MKKFYLLLILAMAMQDLVAQLNMEFRSSIGYSEDANDIWGYVAPDNREYALVGLEFGVSIIDVTDPDNLVDLGKATGSESTWRDIKTWGEYAYIITENDASDGVLVIDLSNLPNELTTDDWYYIRPDVGGGEIINFCHNIYIDENGYAYLAGCNPNNGGPLIFDVFSTPGAPKYVGRTPAIYSHDVYAESNKLYTSDINAGVFSIYDVTDKTNPVFLGSQVTEAAFTHNVWLSDDETIAFTTDERPNAPVGAYDVSDPEDIVPLDQFRPLETLGEGVIPHNTHVWNDYLIVSYYSDGCILVDASEPDHLIEVGNFDTYIPNQQGFNGAWGAYPYLPSQTILVSDIDAGLFVLTPTYMRAARLKGVVVDSLTGLPIKDVEVIIESDQTNFVFTDFQGRYKTGVAEAGTYNVTYTRFGYASKTISMDLENGEIVSLETKLIPLASISGTVQIKSSGVPIPNAEVGFSNGSSELVIKCRDNGTFNSGLLPGNYEVLIGAWGFKYKLENVEVIDGAEFVFELEPGYEDNFGLDLGWTIGGNAVSGNWERGEPNGTTFMGQPSNPNFDLDNDLGNKCYITGNDGGGAGADDVDNGSTILTSPKINLKGYTDPVLNFSYWWFNDGGNSPTNDQLKLVFLDASGAATDEIIYDINTQWQAESFNLKDHIDIDGDIQIAFETGDLGQGHLVEAAIDGFSIIDNAPIDYPSFSVTNGFGCAPLELELNDISDSTTAWNWTVSLQGGSTQYSADTKNPTITIEEGGIYNIVLEATTGTGQVYTVAQNNSVVVYSLPELDNFSYTFNDGVVTFTANAEYANSWQWDFGDGTNSLSENPIHDYFSGELYDVSLVATNSCGTVTAESVVMTGLVSSIEDNLQSEHFIKYYPNPFENEILVNYDLNELKNGFLRLINIQGQLVNHYDLDGTTGTIAIGSELNAGIYFLQVIDDKQAYAPSRIVKLKK